MFVSGKPHQIRSVSAVPAKCGCGAGGGLPAKHVVLMSVYAGHNLHSQNPYCAFFFFFYFYAYLNGCCVVQMSDNSVHPL